MRQRWGLALHQEMSPALRDKLAFTVTATRSYAESAIPAQKWNCPVGDSTVQALTLRLGTQAERQTQMRLERVVAELTPQRAVSQLAVFMLDGYLVRYRRAGWDKKRTRKKRVEWHEIKAGVSYLQEQAPRIEGGWGVLNEKGEVCWQGEGAELRRRLHWEARKTTNGTNSGSLRSGGTVQMRPYGEFPISPRLQPRQRFLFASGRAPDKTPSCTVAA